MTFNFNVNPKSIDTALSRANSVMSTTGTSQAKSFFIEARKGVLSVIAFTSDTFVKIRVAGCKPVGEGKFAFAIETLTGIVKNRSEMSFDFNGKQCKFKLVKGKYSGDFVVLAITEDQNRMMLDFETRLKSGDSKNTVSRDVLLSIREGLRYTNIRDVYTDKPLISHLVMNAGNLSVACLDNHHFAYYKVKVESDLQFKIALPSSHFSVIDKVAQDEEHASFYFANQNIRIEGTGFKMLLPATQVEDKAFNLVPDFLKSLTKISMSAKYTHDNLVTLIDNLYTLYSINTKFSLNFKPGDKGVTVKFVTQNGNASDVLPIEVTEGKASVSEHIDPRLLKDSVNLLKGQKTTVFEILKERAIVFKARLPNKAIVTLVNSVSE